MITYILVVLFWCIMAATVLFANKEMIADATSETNKNILIIIFIIFAPNFLLVEALETFISCLIPDDNDDIWKSGGGRIG